MESKIVLPMDSVELYDLLTNKWSVATWKLPKPLMRMGAHLAHGNVIGGGSTCREVDGCYRPSYECWMMREDMSWIMLPEVPTGSKLCAFA